MKYFSNIKNRRLFVFVKSKIKAITPYFTAYTAYAVFSYSFDYPFYYFVLDKFGIVYGGIIMMTLATFIDLLTLVIYLKTDKDFFGVETIKDKVEDLKKYHGNNIIKKISKIIIGINERIHLFVKIALLSIEFNPFVITVMLRKHRLNVVKLTKRDVLIFTSSLVFGNIYWFLVMAGLFTLIKNYLLGFIVGIF